MTTTQQLKEKELQHEIAVIPLGTNQMFQNFRKSRDGLDNLQIEDLQRLIKQGQLIKNQNSELKNSRSDFLDLLKQKKKQKAQKQRRKQKIKNLKKANVQDVVSEFNLYQQEIHKGNKEIQKIMNDEIQKVLHEQTQQGEGDFNMVDDTVPNKKIVFIKTPNELYLDNRVLTQKSTQQSSSLATGVTFAIELLDYANGRLCPFTEYMRSEEAEKFYGQDLDINKMYVLIRKFQKSYSYGIKPYLKKNEKERIYLAVCDVEASQILSFSQEQVDDKKKNFFENVLGKINKVVEENGTNYVVFKKKSRVGSTETKIPCTNDNLDLIANKSTNYLPTTTDGDIITSTGMLNVFDFHNSILILKYPTNEDFYYIMNGVGELNDVTKKGVQKIQYQVKKDSSIDLTYMYKNWFYELAFPVFFNKTDSSYKYSFKIIDEIKKNNLGGLLESDRQGFREEYFNVVSNRQIDDSDKTYKGRLTSYYKKRNRDKELAMLKNILIKKFMENKDYQNNSESQIREGLDTLFEGYGKLFEDAQKQKLVKQKIKKDFNKRQPGQKTPEKIMQKLGTLDGSKDKLEIQALNQLLNDTYYNYKNPLTYSKYRRRRNIIDELTGGLNKEGTEQSVLEQLEKRGKNILTPEQIQSILINKTRDVSTLLTNYDDNKKEIKALEGQIENLDKQIKDSIDQEEIKRKEKQKENNFKKIARLRNKKNQLIKAINKKYEGLQKLEAKDLRNLYGVRNLGYSIPYTSSGKQREELLKKLKNQFQLSEGTTAPEDIKKSIDEYFKNTMTQSQRRNMLKEKLKEKLKNNNESLKTLIADLELVENEGGRIGKELLSTRNIKQNIEQIEELKRKLSLNKVEKQALLQLINGKTLGDKDNLTQGELKKYRKIKEGPVYTNILSKKDDAIQNALVELQKTQLLREDKDVNQKIKKSLQKERKQQYQEKALLQAVNAKLNEPSGYENIFGKEGNRSEKLQKELLRIAKKYPVKVSKSTNLRDKVDKLRVDYRSAATELATKASSFPGAISSGISSITPNLENVSNPITYIGNLIKNYGKYERSNKEGRF